MHEDLVKQLRAYTKGRCPLDRASGICGCIIASEAADVIEELRKPRWIPVTERLPEDLQTVLVVRKDGGIYCWMYSACSPTDEVWFDEYANAFSVYDVTHWIPLPEPPKEEHEPRRTA